jgi:hypothetical protein
MLKTFNYLYLIDYETPPLLLEEKGQGVEVVYDTAPSEWVAQNGFTNLYPEIAILFGFW